MIPETIIWEELSNRRILKFVIFLGTTLNSLKNKQTFILRTTVFPEKTHRRINHAILAELRKKVIFSALIIWREKPRDCYHADQGKIFYRGLENYHAETLWPWKKEHSLHHGLERHYAETWPWNEKNKTLSGRSQMRICGYDMTVEWRKNSARSRTRTCEKTTSMKTLCILRKRPLRIAETDLKLYTISILFLSSLFHSFLSI